MKPLLFFVFGLFLMASATAQNSLVSNPVANGETNMVIKVYPNPCDGNFTIQTHTEIPSGTVDLYVLNILGQPVYHEKIVADNAGNIQKPVNVNSSKAAAPGWYFVKIDDGYSKFEIVRLRID